MSQRKRSVPAVDRVTPDLEALLAQFTDEEIETGIIARGGAAIGAAERHTAEALRECFADALHSEAVSDDRSTAHRH